MRFIPEAVTKKAADIVLSSKMHSPTILFGAGVVGVVATAVLASKATLKAGEVLDRTKEGMDKATEVRDMGHPDYSAMDYRKDVVYVYTRGIKDLASLYAPTLIVGTLSIACLAGSHRMLTQRNLALTAAYSTLDKAFKEYRKRVVAEYGEDRDRELFHGYKEHEVVHETKKGEPKVTRVRKADPNHASGYSRWFAQGLSTEWEPRADLNLHFLRVQQEYFNHRLRAKGYVFLSEVYNALGLGYSQAATVVGWRIANDADAGDNYIDFGIWDDNETNRDFVNGERNSILLDFNVDGVIFDKIEEGTR